MFRFATNCGHTKSFRVFGIRGITQLNQFGKTTEVWMLLIAMEESRQKSYAEVANVLYGSRAGIVVDVTIAMYNFGVLVSYVSALALFFFGSGQSNLFWAQFGHSHGIKWALTAIQWGAHSSNSKVMIIGDIVPSFLGFLNAPELLQDRTLVLVLSGIFIFMPLSSMPSVSVLHWDGAQWSSMFCQMFQQKGVGEP